MISEQRAYPAVWVQGVLLGILVFAAYLPALSAKYIWDDDWHVTNNACLRSVEGLEEIWFSPSRPGRITTPQYYPLVHTTFWVEYHLWELRPFGYHLDNVLIHLGSVVLLWRLLVRLGVPGAWFAAAIWGVHPVQVETVAWITERKNTLSALFYLAAATAYLRGDFGRRGWGWYGGAFALFVCALLSKTVTSTLPAALLLILWWKRGRIVWRDVWPLIPFFIVGALFGLHTSWMERHVIGAVGADWNFTFVDRVLIASHAACFYLIKLFFPISLCFNYFRWSIDPHSWVQWVPVVFCLMFTAILILFSYRGVLVAWLFFLGTVGPALGFFNVYPMRYSFVADHFQYLASIGPIAVATAAVYQFSRPKQRRRGESSVVAVPVLFVLTLGTFTFARCRVFYDGESLWRDTLVKNPGSWMAHQNLGNILLDEGRLGEAKEQFLQVIELKKDHVDSRLSLARVAEARHDAGEEERWLREAILIEPVGTGDREVAVPYARLGIFLAEQGRVDEAIGEYQAALRIAPGYPLAVTNLGNLYTRVGMEMYQGGKLEEAVKEFEKAVGVHSTAETHNNLGIALAAVGRNEEARGEYEKALGLDAGFAAARRNLDRLGR
jgi:Tfp pilus assembly protein PilF